MTAPKEIDLTCPHCSSRLILVTESTQYWLDTGDLYCQTMKMEDADAPCHCPRCEWRGCRRDLVPSWAKEPAWIPWEGGECPVPGNTWVRIRFADGEESQPAPAKTWYWGRDQRGDPSDVTAYQLAEEPA